MIKMATERVLKEMRENEEKFVGDLQKIVLLRQKLKLPTTFFGNVSNLLVFDN